jgi:K+-transporting ATPase A subunit
MLDSLDLPWIIAGLATALLLSWPLGAWLARLYAPAPAVPDLGDRVLVRLFGPGVLRTQGLRQFATSMLALHAISFVVTYLVLVLQEHLTLDLEGMAGLEPTLAFELAMSLPTDADLHRRVGEQALGEAAEACLVWLRLVSIATSISVLAAFARILAHGAVRAGSFARDACRLTFGLLVPCAFVAALLRMLGVEPESLAVVERVSMLATWMACAWMLGRMLGVVRHAAVVLLAWTVLYGVVAASAPWLAAHPDALLASFLSLVGTWLDAVLRGLDVVLVGVLPRGDAPAWNVATGLVSFFARWISIVLLLSFAARFAGKEP